MLQKLQLFSFFFMKYILSLVISTLSVILKILNDQDQAIYGERFSLKITNKSDNKGLKYYIFRRKKWRAKTIILKGNKATRYTEYKQYNTRPSWAF